MGGRIGRFTGPPRRWEVLDGSRPEDCFDTGQIPECAVDRMPAVDQPAGEREQLHEVAQAAAQLPGHHDRGHDVNPSGLFIPRRHIHAAGAATVGRGPGSR